MTANLAVDVVVGSDSQDGHVDVALAVGAREALLVIKLTLDHHLLGLSGDN